MMRALWPRAISRLAASIVGGTTPPPSQVVKRMFSPRADMTLSLSLPTSP